MEKGKKWKTIFGYHNRKHLLLNRLLQCRQVLFQETLEFAENKQKIPFNLCRINEIIANSEILGMEE